MMNRQTAPRRLATLGLPLLLAALMPATGAFATSAYTITDLGANVIPFAINETGQVAGENQQNGLPSAFLYSGGVMNHFLGSTYSIAYGLNNLGQVAGHRSGVPFVYDGAAVTDLVPGILNSGEARGINDSGQIVGGIDFDFTAGFSPFVYHSAGNSLEIIPGVEAGGNTIASAINESGQFVVNYIDNSGNATTVNARLYDNLTSFTEVPRLVGSSRDDFLTGWAINNQGHMTGSSTLTMDDGTVIPHAFLFDGTNIIDLGVGSGSFEEGGRGINDLDQVVGGSTLFGGGTVTDLNTLLDPASGWTIGSTFDINNGGQIVGTGSLNGESHGFLLTPTPVPVPAAVWLFGSGLAGLVGLARRRMTA